MISVCHVILFQCLAGKGNLKEAIQYLRKALKLEPDSKVCYSYCKCHHSSNLILQRQWSIN